MKTHRSVKGVSGSKDPGPHDYSLWWEMEDLHTRGPPDIPPEPDTLVDPLFNPFESPENLRTESSRIGF